MREAPNGDDRTAHEQKDAISLWKNALSKIPGGSQLLSKRAEMFAPDQWPAYYGSAKGVEVTTIDGETYTDMSIMGVGACILGYADEDVNAAVHDAVDSGSMATLNAPEEVTLADKLLDIHPWAEMVRYARTGGETMTIAVRLARAYTGEDTVAFCGYHGWHDWYLAANLSGEEQLEEHLLPGLEPAGVPDGLAGTSIPFNYNDFERLEEIASNNDLGAIVLEPIRYKEPDPEFLENVRALATELDVPLIVDEITAGFRLTIGGAHQQLDITPDIAVYGKAIANGYAMGAVVGKEHVMDLAQESFISSTFWTERIGPVAALETINKLERENVPEQLTQLGTEIMAGIEEHAAKHGLPVKLKSTEMEPLATWAFKGEDAQAMQTLFTQEMLDRGYLASTSTYVSHSHTADHVETYLSVVDEVFETIAHEHENGSVKPALNGPVSHSKFERLN